MRGIRGEFESVEFTQEEKNELAARLRLAAEQEGNMTDQTKRRVRKLSRGVVIGLAAALILTVGGSGGGGKRDLGRPVLLPALGGTGFIGEADL